MILKLGTTTAEAKTGYGLESASELLQLQALLELNAEGPLEIVPTWLGAHAIPRNLKPIRMPIRTLSASPCFRK